MDWVIDLMHILLLYFFAVAVALAVAPDLLADELEIFQALL